MPISHESRRIALALLLPLYVRSTKLFDIVLHAVCVGVATTMHLHFRNKLFRVDTAKSILIALGWCRCANNIADFVVQGAWDRLILSFIISLDGMGELLPGWPKLKTYRSELRAYNARAPILVGPVIAGFALAWFLNGSYNNGASKLYLIFDICSVGCVLAVALENLAILVLNMRSVDRQHVQGTLLEVVTDAMNANSDKAAEPSHAKVRIQNARAAAGKKLDRRGTAGNRPVDWEPPKPLSRRRG